MTGVVFISGTLRGKRLELLRQFVPKAGTIAMPVYPGIAETEAERAEVQAARKRLVSRFALSRSAARLKSRRQLQ